MKKRQTTGQESRGCFGRNEGQNARSDMAKEARKMLADEDITIPDELVMNLVAEDADGTKAAVEAFQLCIKRSRKQ